MRYPFAPIDLFAALVEFTLPLSLDEGKGLLVVYEFKVFVTRESYNLQDHQNLIYICVTREQRSSLKELSEDTADTPHIQRLVVGFDEKTNLGCSIPPGNDISRLFKVFIDFPETTRKTKITNLEIAIQIDQNIRWLEISVHDVGRMHIEQTS